MMGRQRCTGHNGERIMAGNGCKGASPDLLVEKAAKYLDYCRIVLFLVLLSLWFAGCYHSPDPSKKNYKYTAEDVNEANVMALCLSGTITAPETLSNLVLTNLAEIRSSYGREFALTIYGDGEYAPFNPIKFEAPWVPSCILISFEPGTAQLVANGQYHDWDELNRQYRVSYIDLRTIRYNYVEMGFKGQLHPRRLSELYAKLPGVRYAQPNYRGGGNSWIYPSSQAGSGLTYLFRYGWGDCPAGCIYNEFWYFISYASGETVFAGYWNPQKDPIVPDWWPDAKRNIEQFRAF
jgi:hypothetical protein